MMRCVYCTFSRIFPDRSQEVGFSRKHHSSEGCATVWGGAEMREGPEWRRRATGGRPEVRGSTRGGPEMNRKTGDGPEIRGTTRGGPEVDQKEDRMKKKTSEDTEFTPESSRRQDEKLRLSP
ncbi:hypothetical protein B0H10DRAFT_2198941 [Mycena sp. CBHHK59/15]|nr:hypothetical protein B0H10DRAFT_2198941 [Mycena sp. CBHHK59/15]